MLCLVMIVFGLRDGVLDKLERLGIVLYWL